jgi:hypothetical protein
MGQKTEISWKRPDEDGGKVEVNARFIGAEWRFFRRSRRFDPWEPLPDPPLEDWLTLLDGVERRIQRRLLRPEEGPRLRKRIKELHPETDG